MSNKFLTLLANGTTHLISAIATSSGAADKNKIVATDDSGKLDLSLMPSDLGVEAEDMTASEAIAPGEFINIFDDAGTRKVRLADASADLPAHGFVLAGIAADETGKVYTAGVNSQLTSLIPGGKYFLDVSPGGIRSTITIASSEFVQALGTAIDTTALRFEFDEPIYID